MSLVPFLATCRGRGVHVASLCAPGFVDASAGEPLPVCLLSDLKQGKPLKLIPHDAVAFTGSLLQRRAVLNGHHAS